MFRNRYIVDDPRSSAALNLARALGVASRAWGQVGLGTIFQTVGRVAPPLGRARCQVEFAPGDFFETNVFEPYWAPTVIAHRPYEPELAALFQALRGIDATFVDCGANFGYWSIITTGSTIGFRRAVAIEPNPTTFARLAANAKLNSDRFVCLQKAVSDKDGERVTLTMSDLHAVARIADGGGGQGVEVETTTIDSALASVGWTGREPVILKLDVEGHEIKAISGARQARERADHLIVFEDWSQTDFGTTRSLLEEGYVLAYLTVDAKCQAIRDVAEARRWVDKDGKLNRACNFIATKPGSDVGMRVHVALSR